MPKKEHGNKRSPKRQPGFRGRIWIDGPDGVFIGHGRVVLLERIREHGSITKAAKSMEMAYRHAWDLVDSMNRQAVEPFVVVATGGRGGGGAQVTEAGEKAIKLFWKLQEDFRKFLEKEQRALLKKYLVPIDGKKKQKKL